MTPCLECQTPFKPVPKNKKFCCQKCHDAYHNREKRQAITLPDCFRQITTEYAEGWEVTLKEAAAKIYAQGLHWEEAGHTLTSEQIFGKPE